MELATEDDNFVLLVPVEQQLLCVVQNDVYHVGWLAGWLVGGLICGEGNYTSHRIAWAWQLGCSFRAAAHLDNVDWTADEPDDIPYVLAPDLFIFAWLLTNAGGYWCRKTHLVHKAMGGTEWPQCDHVKIVCFTSIGECVAFLHGAGATSIAEYH